MVFIVKLLLNYFCSGDLTTLALLSWIASLLYSDLTRDRWLAPTIIVAYLFLVVPFCFCVAWANEYTKKVYFCIVFAYIWMCTYNINMCLVIFNLVNILKYF